MAPLGDVGKEGALILGKAFCAWAIITQHAGGEGLSVRAEVAGGADVMVIVTQYLPENPARNMRGVRRTAG